MTHDLISRTQRNLDRIGFASLPKAIASSGEPGIRRFVEFFVVTIRNKNTRLAYAHAIRQFFAWTEARGVRSLDAIEPVVIAAYVEGHCGSPPTVKQHLAAIRMLFDWLVTGHVVQRRPLFAAQSTSSGGEKRPCSPLTKRVNCLTRSIPRP